MYAWLWRKLPFGLRGKVIGSIALALATVALLWYVVFPWAEPILPFDDVQVTSDEGVPGGGDPGLVPPGDVVSPDPSAPGGPRPSR